MFPGPLGVLPRPFDPSMGYHTMGIRVFISLALLLACVLFQPGFCDSSSTNTLTINSVNSCDICKCGFLDLKCSGKSLIVKSLPDFVREIEISGDAKEGGGVIFERGAIRVRDESSVFKVVVSKASIGKKHALKKYERFILNTSCFYTMCDFHNFGLIFAGQCTVCQKS